MTRQELTLAMLALADGKTYSPVQIQKALFLATRNLPDIVTEGEGYSFQPYDYGPFDKGVYGDIWAMAQEEELAEVRGSAYGRWNEYRATEAGVSAGEAVLDRMSPREREYLTKISNWVRSLSFTQLVSAIYEAYPEMRKNSIFVE